MKSHINKTLNRVEKLDKNKKENSKKKSRKIRKNFFKLKVYFKTGRKSDLFVYFYAEFLYFFFFAFFSIFTKCRL